MHSTGLVLIHLQRMHGAGLVLSRRVARGAWRVGGRRGAEGLWVSLVAAVVNASLF